MEKVNKWSAHYPSEIPLSIDYDNVPLHTFLEQSATRHSNQKALHFMGKEMTFHETLMQSEKMANYLQSIGVEKGDRVSVMLPNCPQAVIAYYGILMAGGVVVQTNPLYKERELEYQVNDAGAKVIVCLDILLPLVSKVKTKTDIDHVIVTSIKDYLPFPKNLIYPHIQKKEYNMVVKVEQSEFIHVWKQILDYTTASYTKVKINPKDDLALLQYTGGTTGPPKGVMLTHYNLVANVQMCEAWLYKTKKKPQVVLGVLPFFHVYGMTTVMNLSIMQASKMILLPKFNPGQVLKTITKQKPTLFPGAPTIYIGIINHPHLNKYDLSSIEACISGSAALPIEVQEQFEEITGGKLVEGYGLTEASPVTHANFIWDKRINGSVGVPWPDTEARVVKLENPKEEAEVGDIGELIVKGPQIMKGYWNNPEETEKVLKEGWLFTGDLGYMDKDGYFYIVDRKKDVIIAGGFNVYPREVEEVLYEHEAVLEVAVVGVPDTYRGETVKAYIALKEGYQLEEDELDQHCRKHLAGFKVPRIYEFRDELPKTTVGKILKRKLVDDKKKRE